MDGFRFSVLLTIFFSAASLLFLIVYVLLPPIFSVIIGESNVPSCEPLTPPPPCRSGGVCLYEPPLQPICPSARGLLGIVGLFFMVLAFLSNLIANIIATKKILASKSFVRFDKRIWIALIWLIGTIGVSLYYFKEYKNNKS
ncbi:hypothetical protein HY990_00885 [Candidatus Micrarchaeota archaeon]|nr:hypothetical protein [Candidatus Micrarchaeota archaeon]